MAKLVLKPLARLDLKDIARFIAKDSTAQALQFTRKLYNEMERLQTTPLLGRKRSDLRDGLYSLPHKNYLVFYMLPENYVEIIRVLHGARDIQPDIFEN